MAIQIRRGAYEDFDPNEMLAGELAMVQSGDTASSTGRSIYACFEPGVVKRLADYEDLGDQIAEAGGIYIDDIRTTVNNAQSATAAAQTAAEAARQAASVDISSKTVTFTAPTSPSSLASGESLATLIGKLQAYINNRSYVGMIIHSTTLNTEAKVKAQYGGTKWIRHSGYFLYGASSGVTASTENDLHNTADGGESTHTLTVNEMPSHDHGGASLQGEFTSYAWSTGYASGIMSNKGSNVNVSLVNGSDIGQASYGINASHTHSVNGGGQAHNNMPPYKNVYIWERTQ